MADDIIKLTGRDKIPRGFTNPSTLIFASEKLVSFAPIVRPGHPYWHGYVGEHVPGWRDDT